MSVRDQIFEFGLQCRKPAHLRAAHGGTFGGRIVVGAGKVVEAVGDVERKFGVRAAVARAFLYRPFNVDDEVAGRAVFAGNRFAAEADDIRRPVFAEEFAVVLRNAGVVRQQQGDFLPDGFRIGSLKRGGQFSGQPADGRQVDPAFLPVYQCGFHF